MSSTERSTMNPSDRKVIDISDGICAYVQGGIGNQLFILAAALEQSKRLDCPLYIDSSKYLARDPLDRGYETQQLFQLDQIDIEATHISSDSPWYRNSPRRPRFMRANFRQSSKLNVYLEKNHSYNNEINTIKPGTTIYGYFQSPRYFEHSVQSISKFFENKLISLDKSSFSGVNVHVRRGDYLLQANSSTLGLASTEYFKRAMELISQITGKQSFQIFSDSPELVKIDFEGNKNISFRELPKQNNPLYELLELSNSEGLIMSNSSFSWWAGWLMQAKNESSYVIAPRPWQLRNDNSSQILPKSWISLG